MLPEVAQQRQSLKTKIVLSFNMDYSELKKTQLDITENCTI